MTNEQQRKMLECAAKACGFECGVYEHSGANSDQWFYVWNEDKRTSRWWNPLSNPSDTAEMCSDLKLWGMHDDECVSMFNQCISACAYLKDHGNSRLKAWMFAATMCAA